MASPGDSLSRFCSYREEMGRGCGRERGQVGQGIKFPVAQWLGCCTLNVGGPGSIPGQGTRGHMLQLRVRVPQLRNSPVATKTQCSQINIP